MNRLLVGAYLICKHFFFQLINAIKCPREGSTAIEKPPTAIFLCLISSLLRYNVNNDVNTSQFSSMGKGLSRKILLNSSLGSMDDFSCY